MATAKTIMITLFDQPMAANSLSSKGQWNQRQRNLQSSKPKQLKHPYKYKETAKTTKTTTISKERVK